MYKLLIISLNGDPLAQYGTEHTGGQVKYILELGKNLIREGWMIDVFTIKNNNLPDIESITEGFDVIRFALPKGQNYSYLITDTDIEHLQCSMSTYIIQNNCTYNLLFCCYWLSGLAGLPIKKILKKSLIMSFCSLGYFKQMLSDSPIGLEKRIETEAFIANECDHIIATSLIEKNTLVKEYKISEDKISVIPRGVDLNVFYRY